MEDGLNLERRIATLEQRMLELEDTGRQVVELARTLVNQELTRSALTSPRGR